MTGSVTHRQHREAHYGGIPSWLPHAKVRAERTLVANPSHPVLAIQGNSVSIRLGGARVLATAVGPSVPEEGRFPVRPTSPCTFVISLSTKSGIIQLNPRAFTLVDDLGHLRHPSVSALGGGPPPRRIVAGERISLRLHAVLPTGDGGLSWTPSGDRPIVTWDFTVEID